MNRLKILILSAVLFVFAACSDDKNTYQISGTLTNGAGGTLYLMEMENSGVKALDTIVLDSKGRFNVKEKLTEPSIFILQASNDYIMLCPQAGEKIKINADFDNMAVTYSVSGSEESSKLKLLSDKQTMTRVTLKAMSDQLKMMDIENADSLKYEIAKKYQLLRSNQKEFLINFINSNQGSLTTLVALYRNMENTPLIDYREDLDVYEKVLKGLKKKYPDNKNTINLEHFINNVKNVESMEKTINVSQ